MALKSLHPARDSARQKSTSDVKSGLTLERDEQSECRCHADYTVWQAGRLVGWVLYSRTTGKWHPADQDTDPFDVDGPSYPCHVAALAWFQRRRA